MSTSHGVPYKSIIWEFLFNDRLGIVRHYTIHKFMLTLIKKTILE